MAKKQPKPATRRKKASKVEPLQPTEGVQIDFTTARMMEPSDRRNTQSNVMIAFLVDDTDGNEVVYHCHKHQVPDEARKALRME